MEFDGNNKLGDSGSRNNTASLVSPETERMGVPNRKPVAKKTLRMLKSLDELKHSKTSIDIAELCLRDQTAVKFLLERRSD